MAVKQSFNRITVDGDTSTNDTVLALSSCRAGNPEINSLDTEESKIIGEMLTDLLKDLALQIVSDGEGSTKLITIRVEGARSEEEAELAARTIANSALVKTAFFGEDANWGRIIAALGRSSIDFDPDKVSIAFGDVLMVQDGLGLGIDAEAEATRILQQKIFSVTIDLKIGQAASEVYTCDLSIDYVKINADYRT
jgi:glutamate N-acetyltransferase/amino-acid N-acetyltransferase